MSNEKKIRNRGILGTVLFHSGMLLVLLLLALRTPLPLPEEEGVMVNLGYDETGMTSFQMETAAPSEAIADAQLTSTVAAPEDVLVQDTEEAPAIPSENKEKRKQKPEEINPEPAEEKVIEEAEPEPKPQPVVNPRALYKGKSPASTAGGQEGITGEPGDQGVPGGTPGAPEYRGTPGSGNGISYSLGGRGSLMLHKPSYDSREQGKVVVTIKVDRAGNVMSATPGAKGTNVADQALWQLARNAALKSRFKPDPDAPDLQVGTITYNFIRQN
jgi:outer membrane biosynthesis protein TonB